MTAIKIKLGKAQNGYDRSDDVSYDLLARRGSQEWQRVGQVEGSKTCTYCGGFQSDDEYRIGDFSASLWIGDEYGLWSRLDVEIEVEVLSSETEEIRTIAEAKRIIKAWAAEHLEDLAWNA